MLSRKLLTPAWADAAYSVFALTENCEIRVYTEVRGAYDPDLNNYGTPTQTDIYKGPARAQVLRSGERDVVPGVDDRAQTYQFQIRRGSPEINAEMLVEITASDLTTDLTNGDVYRINQAWNSSDSFEKTFYATVNNGR